MKACPAIGDPTPLNSPPIPSSAIVFLKQSNAFE